VRRFFDAGPVGRLSPMVRQFTSRLTDKDVRQRRRAVRKLFELDDPAALPSFIPLLNDDDEWFRARAADAVRRWVGSGNLSEVESLSISEREEVRRLAAEVALRADGSSALLEKLSHDVEHTVRLEAWRSILLADPLNQSIILTALTDPNNAIRRIAVQAVGRSEGDRAETLGLALKDSHRRVVEAALDQLSLSSSPLPDELFEQVAAFADIEKKSPLKVVALRLILPIDWVNAEFSRLAATIDDPSTDEFRALIDFLQDVDWSDNKVVVNALKSSEAPNLLPRLLRGRKESWAQNLAHEILVDEEIAPLMRLRLLEDAHGRECSSDFLDAANSLASSDHELLAQAASSLLVDVEVRTS